MRTRRITRRSGFTLLEVVLTASFLAVLLLASSAAFASNLRAVEEAERLTGGALFLETVMEDLQAQSAANLLVMNGNQIFDRETLAASSYVVDLTTFQAGADLVQATAVLTSAETNAELGRATVLRGGL